MKEQTLELDAIFSDFENLAPLQNGGHLNFTEFSYTTALDIPQTHSRCSALVTHRGPSDSSNEEETLELDTIFSDFKNLAPF